MEHLIEINHQIAKIGLVYHLYNKG